MHRQDSSTIAPGMAMHRLAAWLESSRAALLLIWACFVIPRLLVLLIDVGPTSDAEWYFSRAVMLADGRGYLGDDGAATAFWPAGWPMAISLMFRLTGPSIAAVGLLNLGFALISAWLVHDLGRRLFGTELAGRLGLLLLAIYPNSIGYVPLALTEVFYTALLLGGCWLLVARQSAGSLILAGVVFGVSMRVKAQSLVVVPLIFAIGLLRAPGFWKRLPGAAGRMALLLAVAALTVLPWTIRNHDQLGEWVVVSTNGGFTLLTGNNETATGDYNPQDPVVKALMARKDLGEVARDAEAKRMAVEWIAANPGDFIALMPAKVLRLWAPDGEAEWAYQGGAPGYAANVHAYRALRWINQAYYVALLAGFIAAFVWITVIRVRSRRRWVDWWLLPYGIAAYPTAIALVFSGQSRFHYPVMPFVCMACGWLIAELLLRRAGRSPASG